MNPQQQQNLDQVEELVLDELLDLTSRPEFMQWIGNNAPRFREMLITYLTLLNDVMGD